jgi:predicted nucleic acid-binding protein
MGEYLEKLIDKDTKPELATELIKRLLGAFEIIKPMLEDCNPKPVDPGDLMFLLCALDGHADYLVSEDSDLLNLKDAYQKPNILKRDEALANLSSII